MLPKKHRLTAYEFQKNPLFLKKVYSKNIRLLVKNSTHSSSRFAFVVSKKASKLTTRRNETKRVAREAVRELLDRIKNGKDVLVMVNRTFAKSKAKEVKDELRKLFKQGELF